jgi:hypothetical protein
MRSVGGMRWESRSRGWALSFVLGLAVVVAGSLSAATEFKRFDRSGIAFDYPSGWFVTTRPLSNGVNPVYRFAVSTVRVRRTNQDIGPCLPGIARQLPPGAVLAFLREAVGADRTRSLPRMGARPLSFRLPTKSDSYLRGFAGRTRWLPFKQAGRAFYLGIHVGPQALASTKRLLKQLLDHMQIKAA